MKKLILFFCFVLWSFPTFSHAEEKPSFTLTNETFDGESIARSYVSEKGETLYFFISVPDPYLEQIQQADDPLLEAKKTLTSIYTSLHLTQRLEEVNGERISTVGSIDLTIDSSIKKQFTTQEKEAKIYASIQKKYYDSLAPEEQAKMYNTSLPDYQDYNQLASTKVENTSSTDDKEQKEYKKEVKKETKPTSKTNESDFSTPYLSIFIGLFVIIGIVVLVLRKRG
jgi:hypothetical protein